MPQSGLRSISSSKSPNLRSVSRMPPLPLPGGSCSPVIVPSSTCQLPPVPWPIFIGFLCQPVSDLPSNSSIQPSAGAAKAGGGVIGSGRGGSGGFQETAAGGGGHDESGERVTERGVTISIRGSSECWRRLARRVA